MKNALSVLIGLLVLITITTTSSAQEITHTVKPGDNLWDISSTYLKTPWSWPLVWSKNQDITNPHLIYPGDKVVISKKNGKTTITIISARTERPATQAPPKRELYTPQDIQAQLENTIVVSPEFSSLIYSATPLCGDGKVLEMPTEGIYATTLDEIAIQSGAPLEQDQRIAVASLVHEVKNDDKTTCGYLYQIVALADVTRREGALSKATITYVNREVKSGDIIFDDPAVIKPVTLGITANSTAVSGHITDLFGGVYGASTFDLVFLDRGSAQGVNSCESVNSWVLLITQFDLFMSPLL